MFESINFAIEKEEECEECLTKEFLVDAIVDGRLKRICRRCLIANNAIEIKKPGPIELDIYTRPSVKDVLFRASGIMPKSSRETQLMLQDLEERRKQKLAEAKLAQAMQKHEPYETLDEQKFLEYLERKEKESIEKQERIKPVVLDFSIEATKRTRIRDLLEKMKQLDEMAQEEQKKIKEEKFIVASIKWKPG